jgi:hypothetical protein
MSNKPTFAVNEEEQKSIVLSGLRKEIQVM